MEQILNTFLERKLEELYLFARGQCLKFDISPTHAEDYVHIAYEKVVKQFDLIVNKDDRALSAYYKTVIRRQMIDDLRKRKMKRLVSLEDGLLNVQSQEDNHSRTANKDFIRHIERFLMEDEIEIFRLVYKGFKAEEIFVELQKIPEFLEKFGINTISTISVKIFRARKRLGKVLNNQEDYQRF